MTEMKMADAVAVVLSCTGNHTAETRGGPPIVMGPARPIKAWPTWMSLKYKSHIKPNLLLCNDHSRIS